jgi:hypothetical protein
VEEPPAGDHPEEGYPVPSPRLRRSLS